MTSVFLARVRRWSGAYPMAAGWVVVVAGLTLGAKEPGRRTRAFESEMNMRRRRGHLDPRLIG